MSQLRKVHLFNCDRTYKLDAVEDLLNATKAKLGFDFMEEKHYFSLAQMSEMTTKTIPNLEMDLAFFVVHAHESRLSINEDHAGIGYAKIYRALLQATGQNVIVVIGGDDNYKDEDEEDRVVISRWAWRKISSQFRDDFLDGRKSFIFSWNKKHRAIHEKALVHYFDSSKKGQKFEYQPKLKQAESSKPAQPPTQRNPLQRSQTMDEQRSEDILNSTGSYRSEQRRGDSLFSRSYSAEQYGEDNISSLFNSTEQRREGGLFSESKGAEQREDDRKFSSPSTDTAMVNTAPVNSEQGAVPLLSIGPTKTKDLSVLCCNVSEDSIHAVRNAFEGIASRLKLSSIPPVENLRSPNEVKLYLTRNHIKVCVLVVDGKTVKDAYAKLPQRKVEYQDLLETAADKVDEKVIILVCETYSLPAKDEDMVTRTIENIINKTGKGFIAWLKNGMLVLGPDVLAQVIMSTSVAKASLFKEFQTSTGASGSADGFTKRTPEQDVKTPPWNPPVNTTRGPVMLKGKLRFGKISEKPGDIQIWYPGFKVPDYMVQNLWERHCNTPVAVVKIVNSNDELKLSVDLKSKEGEGIHIASNEIIMLKTRVRHGKVSLEKGDLEYIYPDWQVPDYIIQTLQRDHWATPDGELYVISDEQGNLRHKVHFGTGDRLVGFGKKALKKMENIGK